VAAELPRKRARELDAEDRLPRAGRGADQQRRALVVVRVPFEHGDAAPEDVVESVDIDRDRARHAAAEPFSATRGSVPSDMKRLRNAARLCKSFGPAFGALCSGAGGLSSSRSASRRSEE